MLLEDRLPRKNPNSMAPDTAIPLLQSGSGEREEMTQCPLKMDRSRPRCADTCS